MISITGVVEWLPDKKTPLIIFLLKSISIMKTKIIIISLILLLLSIILIALNYSQTVIGPHDGIVKPAGEYNIELNSTYPAFFAYLLDKKNKPISNSRIICEAEFLFPDSTKISAPLKPMGEDGFALDSDVHKFYSCKISFYVFGKMVSAQFENENAIVKKN